MTEMNFAEQLDLVPQMNLAEQMNLVEQQIRTLNEAQALYPVKNERVQIQLTDTKLVKTYETSDAFLDVFLDSIIIHQSLLDDYGVAVYANDELLFFTYITRAGHDAMKKALDAQCASSAVEEDKTQLIKMVRRPDPRPVKRKEKPAIPSWAVLDEESKTLPSQMYFGCSAEEAEECYTKGQEILYRKLKVKNLPVQDVPTAYLDI